MSESATEEGAGLVSRELRQRYAEEGYMVLESVIPDDTLCMLREECSYFLGYMDARFDAGLAIKAPAGSVVAFSSYNLHCSGANSTERMRRVYLPQYVAAPLTHSRTGERFNLAVPFLNKGRNVYDHAADTPERWGGVSPPGLAA